MGLTETLRHRAGRQRIADSPWISCFSVSQCHWVPILLGRRTSKSFFSASLLTNSILSRRISGARSCPRVDHGHTSHVGCCHADRSRLAVHPAIHRKDVRWRLPRRTPVRYKGTHPCLSHSLFLAGTRRGGPDAGLLRERCCRRHLFFRHRERGCSTCCEPVTCCSCGSEHALPPPPMAPIIPVMPSSVGR